MTPQTTQVLVVGAGIAGCSLAYLLANAGIEVLLIDARPQEKLGHPWLGGVPQDILQQHLPEALEAPILYQSPTPYHIISPDGKAQLQTPTSIVKISLRPLLQLLLQRALDAGVTLLDRTSALRPLLSSVHQSVEGIEARQHDQTITIHADLTVDAGGTIGPVRRWLPPHIWEESQPQRDQFSSCFQEVRSLLDTDGAAAYLEHLNVPPDETVVFPSITGGYSVLQFHVDTAKQEILLFAGANPHQGHPTGLHILRAFRKNHPWIGPRRFGGGGLVPQHKSFFSFLANGFALLGDAAGQGFPVDGTGVSSALISAQTLAQAVLETYPQRPPTLSNLWSYNVQYQRERGATCAAHQLTRRFLERLSTKDTSTLLHSEIVKDQELRAVLLEQFAPFTTRHALRLTTKAPRRPRLLTNLSNLVSRTKRVFKHYQKFPAHYSPEHFHRWKRRASNLLR